VESEYHCDTGVNDALVQLLAALKTLKERCGRTATVILIPHAFDEPIFIAEEDGPISNRCPPDRVLGVAMAKRRDV